MSFTHKLVRDEALVMSMVDVELGCTALLCRNVHPCLLRDVSPPCSDGSREKTRMTRSGLH